MEVAIRKDKKEIYVSLMHTPSELSDFISALKSIKPGRALQISTDYQEEGDDTLKTATFAIGLSKDATLNNVTIEYREDN